MKIEDMSLERVLNELGIVFDFYKYPKFLKVDTDFNDRVEFLKKARGLLIDESGRRTLESNSLSNDEKELSIIKLADLLIEHEDIIDKDKYLFELLKYMDEHIKRDKNDLSLDILLLGGIDKDSSGELVLSKNKVIEKYNKIEKYISSHPVVEAVYDPEDDEVVIDDSEEFLKKHKSIHTKESNAQKKIELFDKYGVWEHIKDNIKPTDLIYIFSSIDVGNAVAKKLLNSRNKKISEDDRKKIAEEYPNGIKENNIYSPEELVESIKKYARFVDFDKLLLKLLMNKSKPYTSVRMSMQPREDDKEKLEEIIELEKLIEEKLITNKAAKVSYGDTEGLIHTDLKVGLPEIKDDLENLHRGFIRKKYHDPVQIELLKRELLVGKKKIEDYTPDELLGSMQLKSADFLRILKTNPNSLKYILDNSLLSIGDIIKGYMSSSLDIDSVMLLKEYIDNSEEMKEKIKNDITSQKLVELFEDDSKKYEFSKYSDIYRVFYIDGKDIKTQKDVADDIIEKLSEDSFENKTFYTLYQNGLIPLESVIEYVGDSLSIPDLFSLQILKPRDTRRLIDSKVISLDSIKEIVKRKNIDLTRRISLIFSTFPEIKDANIREELVNCMENAQNFKQVPSSSSTITRKVGEGEKKEKHASDPCLTWQFMKKVDPNHSIRSLRDGTTIFFLHSIGKVVIEKMYDRGSDGNMKWAFGAATYIVDAAEFARDSHKYIVWNTKNSGVDRKALVDLSLGGKNNGYKKVVHGETWGERMCKEFHIDTNPRYSQNDRVEIKKIADSIKDSRRIVR